MMVALVHRGGFTIGARPREASRRGNRALSVCLGTLGVATLVGLGLASPLRGDVEGYHFVMPELTAAAGEHVRITVKGEHESSAQGFVFAARYPSSELTIERVHIEDTILEAIEVDFFDVQISPEDGTLVVAVLVDSRPPFDGELIPNIGFGLNFFHIEAAIAEEAEGDLSIALTDGISLPPVANLYSVNNQSFPVSELGQAVVHLGEAGRTANFLRGDVNMDEEVDISDPIAILGFAFEGRRPPACMLAADANDDDQVDISDPIYTLDFLFAGGRSLPSPHGVIGRDPTPGTLGCAHGLEPSQ